MPVGSLISIALARQVEIELATCRGFVVGISVGSVLCGASRHELKSCSVAVHLHATLKVLADPPVR